MEFNGIAAYYTVFDGIQLLWLCQLTDAACGGAPLLVYPQRVECTVVDFRVE